MNNKKKLLLVVLALVVLICGASALYNTLGDRFSASQLSSQEQSSDGDASQEQRTLAPDFTVYTLEGEAVKLSDMRGRPLVLNFWSSRCGPCVNEMPEFNKVHTTIGHEVQFMMVNVTDGSWDTIDSASSFIEQSGYTFPVFYDTGLQASMAYSVYSLPTTYFIDAEGYVVAYGRGSMDMNTLLSGIEMIA